MNVCLNVRQSEETKIQALAPWTFDMLVNLMHSFSSSCLRGHHRLCALFTINSPACHYIKPNFMLPWAPFQQIKPAGWEFPRNQKFLLSHFQCERILIEKDTMHSDNSKAIVWQTGDSCEQNRFFFFFQGFDKLSSNIDWSSSQLSAETKREAHIKTWFRHFLEQCLALNVHYGKQTETWVTEK